jgi:glycosyltransferase involved in cell wall biosynthesis
MEAAAMGLPIIASDIRGCRQVVEHRRTGLLVPVRSPGVLGSAIATLASDGARRRSMGEEARRKALAEFDDRRQTARTLEVYGRLLGHGRSRRRRLRCG